MSQVLTERGRKIHNQLNKKLGFMTITVAVALHQDLVTHRSVSLLSYDGDTLREREWNIFLLLERCQLKRQERLTDWVMGSSSSVAMECGRWWPKKAMKK